MTEIANEVTVKALENVFARKLADQWEQPDSNSRLNLHSFFDL